MTRISSYRLYQCSSCGQKHIDAVYGSVNLMISKEWPKTAKADDLFVCQRCSTQKPLKNFIPLGVVPIPPHDSTPKWIRSIEKFLDINYKEPAQHPMRLYPDLSKVPFDPDNYYPAWIRKNMVETDYPDWYTELSRLK